MNQPWGLSGPQFLSLYAAAVAASVLLTAMVWAVLRRGRVEDAAPDVYTLAVVSGGTARVVDTAVHALLEGGHLRVNRSHVISVCDTDAPDEPVQRAVLDCLKHVRSTNLAGVRRLSGKAEAVRRVGTQAARNGFLLSAARRRAAKAAVLPQVAVLGVGVARLVNGIRLGRPVGFLVLALIADLVLIALSAARTPRTTRAGEAWVRRASRHRTPESLGFGPSASAAVPVPAAVLGVAALGAAGIEDGLLRESLYGGLASSSSGGGGSGATCSTGSSCGSSCGGGCGGGCGG